MRHPNLLALAAMVALAAGSSAEPVMSKPTQARPRRPQRQPNTKQERDIAESNAAVDARKAEKRAKRTG